MCCCCVLFGSSHRHSHRGCYRCHRTKAVSVRPLARPPSAARGPIVSCPIAVPRVIAPPPAADAIVCGGGRLPRLLPPHSAVQRHLKGTSRPQSWWRSTTSPSAVDAAQTPSRICRLALHLRCISVLGPACPRPIASFPLTGYPSRRLGVPQTSTVFRHSAFSPLHWTSC